MGKIRKVLFAAGGTGGHVFPAIAVADAMRNADADIEIAFVGAARGNESVWAQKAGYRFVMLDIDFIKGASFGRKIRNIFALPGCARRASEILRREAPDLVIGSGGYVSGPLVAMAAMRGIPTAIMEQNAIPGLTNRILSKFVGKIYTSFEDTQRLPQKKTVCMGNPVRLSAHCAPQPPEWETSCAGTPLPDGGLHLFIFGGSQGAMTLNTCMPKAIAALPEALRSKICICHQAGKNKLGETKKAYETANVAAKITEFVDDMRSAYDWADLLICRAGATSLAEIMAAGKASILVPFPHAAHNHQEKNADVMVMRGAAIKVRDSEAETAVAPILADLIAHPGKIREMEENALAYARPQAAADIARDCLGIAAPENCTS